MRYVFDERGLTPPTSSSFVEGLDWNSTNSSDGACTLCVVKPHVIRQGGLGAVLSFIAEHGFKVIVEDIACIIPGGDEDGSIPYPPRP